MSLDDLLAKAGLSKAALARHIGLAPDTVTRWRGSPPMYATAYLRLYILVKELWEKAK